MKLCMAIISFMLLKSVIAIETYDNIPITPDTWQEADLTYITYVSGESCINTANILRPKTWLNERDLIQRNVGKLVHLTQDDIGVDANVKLVAIKPVIVSFNETDAAKTNYRPTIGVFRRCSADVTDYTFQGKSGTETLQATPEHPFYSVTRHDYVPIGQIDLARKNGKVDELLKYDNSNVKLINSKKHSNKIEYVYNFEVYKAHNYLIGNEQILVHNPTNGSCDFTVARRNELYWEGELGDYHAAYFATMKPNIFIRKSPTKMKLGGYSKNEIIEAENVLEEIEDIAMENDVFLSEQSSVFNYEREHSMLACQYGVANCEVMALTGANMLRAAGYKGSIELVHYTDHFALRIGGRYIADPWAKDFYHVSEMSQRFKGFRTSSANMYKGSLVRFKPGKETYKAFPHEGDIIQEISNNETIEIPVDFSIFRK